MQKELICEECGGDEFVYNFHKRTVLKGEIDEHLDIFITEELDEEYNSKVECYHCSTEVEFGGFSF